MANLLDKMFAIVLILIAFLVFGPARIEDQNERQSKIAAEEAVRMFSDSVQSKGYITPFDYKLLQDGLRLSGSVFDVSIEHYKKRYQPLYSDPNNFSTFSGTYEVELDGHFTEEILTKLFPVSGALLEDSPIRRYNMRVGDLFMVRVNTQSIGISSQIRSIFMFTDSSGFAYSYGGMIRSEAP